MTRQNIHAKASHIRTQQKAGKLSAESIALLTEVGFDFQKQDPEDGWLPYEEARAYVHTKRFKNWKAWEQYKRSNEFPAFLPPDPRTFYNNQRQPNDPGWKFQRVDWLGITHGRAKRTKRKPIRQVDKWVALAEQLVADFGQLPRMVELRKQFPKLAESIAGNPKRFHHIPQIGRKHVI